MHGYPNRSTQVIPSFVPHDFVSENSGNRGETAPEIRHTLNAQYGRSVAGFGAVNTGATPDWSKAPGWSRCGTPRSDIVNIVKLSRDEQLAIGQQNAAIFKCRNDWMNSAEGKAFRAEWEKSHLAKMSDAEKTATQNWWTSRGQFSQETTVAPQVMSTTTKVAIGVGVLAVLGGAYYLWSKKSV